MSLDKSADAKKWIYASLTVVDGQRHLKPTHVSFDRIYFAQPPRLNCRDVEIIVVNGDEVQKRVAHILPHAPDATHIPIELAQA